MDCAKILLLICSFCVGQLYGEPVNFFTLCENGTYYVPESGNVLVEINGKDWPVGKSSCEAVFRTEKRRGSLYYKFNRFQFNDFGAELRSYSKSVYFIDIGFNRFIPPGTETRRSAGPKLTMTLSRGNLNRTDVFATLDISTAKKPVVKDGNDRSSAVDLAVSAAVGVITGVASATFAFL